MWTDAFWEISITNTDKTDLTDNSLSVLSVLSVFKNKDLTEILSHVIGIIPCFHTSKSGIIPCFYTHKIGIIPCNVLGERTN